MSRVKLQSLRESKLPKYVQGTPWDDFEIRYLMAASTRGRSYEALTGDLKGIIPVNADNGINMFTVYSKTQEAIIEENH